ncbi:endonuclease [Thermoplasmatales archaeon SM1-50]|nr:MAG: endonuclease [Thermoplasmatales archaeon SM1-50]
MKGTYLIVMKLHKDMSIKVGKHDMIGFMKGYYAYVGSALNGLEQRIQRHCRTDKKMHWHIDYLLMYAWVVEIFYKQNTRREECNIARIFERTFVSIPGFGCSDCSCRSHLFHGSLKKISQLASDLRMKTYLA